MTKIKKKYQDHNIKLYELYKEKISAGNWGWQGGGGVVTRFICVKCGSSLKGNEYVTSFIENFGLFACKNITCYDCHETVKSK